MPYAARWWNGALERYAEWKVSEGVWRGFSESRMVGSIRAWPARFEAAGLPRPQHARDVSAELIIRWTSNPQGPGGRRRPGGGRLSPLRVHYEVKHLREFLAWCGCPVARKPSDWRSDPGKATRRRWYDADTLDRLLGAASDRLRPVVALMGWVGLRRNEAWSVRCNDVSLALDAPSVRVTRKGGRVEVLPLPIVAVNALRPAILGCSPSERIYGLSYSTLGQEVSALGAKVGIELASHDLRRSFGRTPYYEFQSDLNDIRALCGHRSQAQTEYYIGVSDDRLRASIAAFDRPRKAPGIALVVEE
ncbi:MAG TPA: tyrosine-type recombinase/integrase [Thermoplasmata archaeon]|nr:tyrosine-type recombinase/integrase [Thermoplasmata archaeon]